MYAPFEYENYQFVDGGIFDNLPVDLVKRMGVDKVIAIKFRFSIPKKQRTMYNIAMHSLDLMTENIIQNSIKLSDYVVEIDIKDTKPFNIKKIDFCYSQGYLETLDNISKIKECLKS